VADKIHLLSHSPTASPPTSARRAFDLIAFPIIDWTFRFQRPQQLLSRFAADGHRVFYLRTAFLGLDRDPRVAPFSTGDRKGSGLARNVYDVALPGEADLDLYSGRLEGETLRQAEDALLRIAADEGIDDAVLFVQYPFWEPLARRLRERRGWRLVYDCLDEHSGFGTHGESTEEDERRLIQESDLVLATSGPLLERLRTTRPDAVRLPNAADAEKFAALPPRATSPLAALPRPVIGYYGAISSWFDAEAVAIAAARHPAWTFALVGDTRGLAPDAVKALEARPNVRLHGEVPYAELPSWVAGFDVCTIPFRRTPLTEATNPFKLYEYLATGKSIVARRLPELEPFADAAVLYDRAEELGPALERALAQTGEGAPRRRRELARANTWETRYGALRERLDSVPRPKATAPEEAREAAQGNAVAARVREIRRLDAVVRERDEGIAFLKAEVAARDRSIDILRAESEDRRLRLETALAELEQIERSRLGRLSRRIQRLRHAAGRATAPGTPLFTLGTRILPRPAARFLRRRFAPVPPAAGVVEAAAASSGARHVSDALPATPSGRYDVVVFSIIDWDFRFQRPQQLATQFGRHGHRVLYLSTTQWLSPKGPPWDLTRKADRVAELRIRSRRALNIYSGALDGADLDALTAAFEELARDLCVGDAVCLVEIPYWAPLAERLRERLGWRVAYDCMDEWTNFPGFGAGVLALEEPLVRSADATIVSADRLLDKWKATAPRLILAKNGMDADHYRAGFVPNALLKDARHPIIGYYGALASWVDAPLLTRIAREHPDATVVLAGGKFDVDLSPVEALPNVRVLGQRPYAEMPQLLWHFDACVIPFLVNDITEATNPVKFYEYIFGGKPVVSPALTELLPYAELCYLARGHDEFMAQLARALA